MRLFGEHGYNEVTVAEIADAADVSRATVFAYYPAKENIVLGDAPQAIEALRTALAAAGGQVPVVETAREWLRTLVGWVEPDIVLQRRLAEEIPAVGAARARVLRDIEAVIAEALAREVGCDGPLAPRLAASALTSALAVAEHEAAQRMADSGQALSDAEVDELLDAAVAFVDGGLARLQSTARESGARGGAV